MMVTMHALHALAYIALRLSPPLVAKRVVDTIGRRLSTLSDDTEALDVSRRLQPFGTCLSRSIAVASRLRDAKVVIGVTPVGRTALHAHAWVEHRGVPLQRGEDVGQVIARL